MPAPFRALLGRCAVAVALTMTLASCTPTESPLDLGDSSDAAVIVVGSQGTPESEILAQIYGQVLEQAGYSVVYDQTLGGRAATMKAIERGTVDLITDYSGSLLAWANPKSTTDSTAEIAAVLPDALEPLNLVALEPAPAENSEALVVSSAYAKAHGLESIGDLAALADITVGARTGFDEEYFDELEADYSVTELTFQSVEGDGSERLKDLLGNVIQLTTISTTSPAIAENDLVVLDDPADLFVAQNVTPVLNKKSLTDEIEVLLNAVSAQLTTRELAGLNARYDGESMPTAAEVARSWLVANGLAR